MTKEVTTQETKAVVSVADRMLAQDTDHVSARDLILPKILVMQGLSKAVADGKAVMGEMRDSLENKLMGTKDKATEFIPFHYNKTWVIFEEGEKGKLEYSSEVPWTPANDDWTWEATENGKKIRRDQAINVYCVIPSEIKEGVFLPYVISFKRTSYKAGKKLLTSKEKLKIAKLPWASKVFKLTSNKTENDLGTFYVFDIETARATTKEEIEAVGPWFDMVMSQKVKVDDSDIQEEVERAANKSEDYKGDIAF